MQSPRDIRKKIRAVRNIQQICRVMRTVASVKLREAEARILAARPYDEALRKMVERLGGTDCGHPLLEHRPVIAHTGIIAVSADKGLAGSFNTNVVREALAQLQTVPGARAITIGRKVSEAVRRNEIETIASIAPLGNGADYAIIAALADHVGQLYIDGAVDRVELVYTRFGGSVITTRVLPIEPPAGVEPVGSVLYEPSQEAILDQLLPRYLRTMIYTAVLSSVAAEHAARVTAMSLATENADDLIHSLTLQYNKSRQAGITGDLTDIVGAVEAMAGH